MARRIIDLRSDFLASPTEEMRLVLLEAMTDRSCFDLREDPRERITEQMIASMLGQEDALLFPTCTMANQVALALASRPGDLVLTQQDAHILTSEAGAPWALSGLRIVTVPGEVATPDIAAWQGIVDRGGAALAPRISAISLENTHNRAGGRVLGVAYSAAIAAHARSRGVHTHLDGSRLANAATSLGVSMATLARDFDTVAMSLNKGIGAPIGAALGASRKLIEAAMLLRHRFGGSMRRFGPLAAAAEVALRDLSHIREDHRRAQLLGCKLAEIEGIAQVLAPIESNLVVLRVEGANGAAEGLARALAEAGVLSFVLSSEHIRFAIYRGVTDADIEAVVEVCARVFTRMSGRI